LGYLKLPSIPEPEVTRYTFAVGLLYQPHAQEELSRSCSAGTTHGSRPALAVTFLVRPNRLLPVFVAMMFAGTLDGNATLIGASANVVSAGICASYGRLVSFVTFMRYGVPLTICQMVVSALYVAVLFSVIGR
jgi:hypothetical protein